MALLVSGFLFVVGASAEHMMNPTDTLLTEWPMLMTHDAATGYLTNELDPVNAWARTQPADSHSFAKQLDCGARAFDFRAHVDDKGSLVFHHASVEVEKTVDEALGEITAWAAKHPDMEDLVLISSWDCSGNDCDSKLSNAFKKHNMTVLGSCDDLMHLTLGNAFSLAALPDGGSVLVVRDCSNGGYDPANTCSGFDGPGHLLRSTESGDRCLSLPPNSSFEEQQACGEKLRNVLPNQVAEGLIPGYYDCWVGATNRDFAFGRLFDYLGNYSSVPAAPGQFVQVQALWQESVSSVVVGVAHLSSLVNDEAKSQLNSMMVKMINADRFKYISFFEVNNVCDSGPELKQALRVYHDRSRLEGAKRDVVII